MATAGSAIGETIVPRAPGTPRREGPGTAARPIGPVPYRNGVHPAYRPSSVPPPLPDHTRHRAVERGDRGRGPPVRLGSRVPGLAHLLTASPHPPVGFAPPHRVREPGGCHPAGPRLPGDRGGLVPP